MEGTSALLEPRKILVGISGAPADEQVVRLACALAKKAKSRVFAVYVLEVERHLPLDSPPVAALERADAALDRAERIAKEEKYPLDTELLQAREAGPALVDEAAQRGVDLVILGLTLKKHRGEYGLGTTVPFVMLRAPCRVWVSREPMPEAATAARAAIEATA